MGIRLFKVRRLTAGLSLAALVFLSSLGSAAADEPLDRPLPEITSQQLAAKIRDAWRSFEKGLLEVTFETEDNTRDREGLPTVPGEPNEQTVLVKFPGRFRYADDGRRWRLAYDAMQIGGYGRLDQFRAADMGEAAGQGHAGQVLEPGPLALEPRFQQCTARRAPRAVSDLS